jgi:glycosyltransferase involved in cell wall biosynthesis
MPVLKQFLKVRPEIKNIAIDMDDAETETFQQISEHEWQNGEYKKWIINRLGLYYMKYYEQHIPESVNIIYYSHPHDVLKYQAVYKSKNVRLFINKVPYCPWDESILNKDQNNILFVGSLNYYPNEYAVHYLLYEIWPLILVKNKNAQLIIAGSKPDKRIRKLISMAQSVTLVENPTIIKDVFNRAAVLIVPLRVAGGTRIKIMQAFSFGVPVVSTSIGVSGIEMNHGETGLIGNSPPELAAHSLELLQNLSLRQNIAVNAYSLYKNQYSFQI